MNTEIKTKRILLVATCVFLGCFFLYLFTSPAKLPEGDEGILLGVADRVIHHGFSRLPPGKNDTKIFSSYGFFEDGFSKYGLGQSLITIPVVRAFRSAKEAVDAQGYTLSVLAFYSLAALLGSLINVLFFLTCLKLGYRLSISFFLTLILGVTTMVWPYAQTLFSDPTLALMWLLALYAFLSFKTTRKPFWLGVAGGAVGFAVLTKIVAAYAVPIFGAYFLYLVFFDSRLRQDNENGKSLAGLFKPTAWFMIPLLVMGYAVLWYNHLRYGQYFSFGYLDYRTYDIRDTMFGFNVPFLAGLYAQLLSSGKGFFFYNPSTLLAFFGWKRLYRSNRAEALVLLTLIGGMILIYSTWYGWHGDWAWGLRYLSCLPPFFLLLSGPCLEKVIHGWQTRQSGYRRTAGWVSLLLAVSFAVQIPGLCIKSSDYILVASEVDVFKGKFFQADWPIRDDSMQMHFIPEFSPLAGHLWMMRVIYHRQDGKAMEIYRSPPWEGLNSLWIPQRFNPSRFRYNIWWLNAQAKETPGAGAIVSLAFILFFLSLTAYGIGLFAALRAKEFQPEDALARENGL